MLGHRCVCAVEWEPFAQAVLVARQNDGSLSPFPVWDDVQTFDGTPWRGIVDIVAGGFPCQDISVAGGGEELMEQDQECGITWPASLAKYDPASHSLKTAQRSLLEDSTGCSVILPSSGSMRNGVCFQRPVLALRTDVNESGYWPTPTVCGNYNRKGASKSSGNGLATAVRMWPTATATAYKGWSPKHNRAATDDRLDYSVEHQSFQFGQQTPPMRLNPDWVEWLMGWPIGQTALKPLETGKFREWQQQHGIFLKDHDDGD